MMRVDGWGRMGPVDDCPDAAGNGFRLHRPLVIRVRVLGLDQDFRLGHGMCMTFYRVICLICAMMMMSSVAGEVCIRMVMVRVSVMLFRVLDRQIDLLLVSL